MQKFNRRLKYLITTRYDEQINKFYIILRIILIWKTYIFVNLYLVLQTEFKLVGWIRKGNLHQSFSTSEISFPEMAYDRKLFLL